MSSAGLDTTRSAPVPRIYRPVKTRVRLPELWSSIGVARMIGLRDLKSKYKQAALGPLWLLIAPLGMLAAMAIAFSGVTSAKTSGIPYAPFALVGLTVWTYIQLSATVGSGALMLNAPLVRRTTLPRLALLTGSLLGNLPPVIMLFTITMIWTVAVRGVPLQILVLPLLVVWLIAFTLGVVLLLSALAARFRDTVTALPLIIQAGIFVSPVGYALKGAPHNIHILLVINPVSGLIEAWRWAILGLPNPELIAIVIAAAWTVLIVGLGWRVFCRLEVNLADYV
jgi:ABC-type polysaccharide/polyol phosphate export permease